LEKVSFRTREYRKLHGCHQTKYYKPDKTYTYWKEVPVITARCKTGADVASDHHLLVARIKLKLKKKNWVSHINYLKLYNNDVCMYFRINSMPNPSLMTSSTSHNSCVCGNSLIFNSKIIINKILKKLQQRQRTLYYTFFVEIVIPNFILKQI
jgi:hypothetical protein